MSNDDYSILRANSINSNDTKIHKSSSSTSPAASSNLNPRSCVTCRRRKVKCDKKHPCSNCIRQSIECVFPPAGRAPRKPRKPLDGELADRLRRLESLVQGLGSQVREEESTPPSEGGEKDKDGTPEGKEETHDEKIQRAKRELKSLVREKFEKQEKENPPDTAALTSSFGKLIVHESRSRYISPGMWAGLKTELDDLKSDRDLLDSGSEEEEDDLLSPQFTAQSQNLASFIFSNSSSSVDMTLLHPQQPEHVAIYWKVCKENVEPLIKMFHIPTREPMILDNATHLHSLSRPEECIMFAIYFAAVTSLRNEECQDLFGEARSDLLARYRFGMEQSLARAEFLKTDSVFVVQAFILYLVCLRPNEDPRIIWSLTSLAVRICQGLGLHRDGSHFPNLTPFKQEMRRRLWYHATVLDLRASEDLGSDPSLYDLMSDVAMPRNLNDSDISHDMKELPESRIGCTDMTFSLIRFEINRLHRFLAFVPPGVCPKMRHHGRYGMMANGRGPGHRFGFEDKKAKLEELTKRIEETYLKDIDNLDSLQWLTATTARLILSKMKLMLYYPFQKDGGSSLPQETRDELFQVSLQSVEITISYQAQLRTRKFSWLLRTYTQWHALAFLLRELCVRTSGPEVERAWEAVDLTLSQQNEEISKLAAHLWKPVQALRARAWRQRQKAIDAENDQDGQKMASKLVELPITANNGQPAYNSNSNGNGMIDMDFGVERLFPNAQQYTPSPNMNTTGSLPHSNALWAHGFPQTTEPMSMNPGVMTNISPIQGSLNGFTSPTTMPGWTADDTSYNFNDATMNMGEDTTNWTAWDDMVQQLAMQDEMVQDGPNMGLFDPGLNLF